MFDIFKIGIGPSSSHTLGPWRAAAKFLILCRSRAPLSHVRKVVIDLYGSLAKTGVGHGTDVAVMLGLAGHDATTYDPAALDSEIRAIKEENRLNLAGESLLLFIPSEHIQFHKDASLPFHPNGMRFTATYQDGSSVTETYFSVGGGFVVTENEELRASQAVRLPYPIESAADLVRHTNAMNGSIVDVVRANELTWRSEDETDNQLRLIWQTMRECIYRGCNIDGVLPGGLNVSRRAMKGAKDLLGTDEYKGAEDWIAAIQSIDPPFQSTLRWISVFALAVNEENAAFGRVVTAPTNGAAGVIPAVMMYAHIFLKVPEEKLFEFLLVAGEIGSLFKKGATISAAMGGCMAEIGVSSAMAAAGHAYLLGCDTDRILMAAEIAMEHHLGMTCDPIGGLVQVPCIERNTMGAMKAITAANIALSSDPALAKISLDQVIQTMWETAQDMNTKYKETAEGGLALRIPVVVPEC
ncbi:L-serine ammonia-lyase [Geitlerinema splendidum]|nr:L-serine ammonia-lyase [Geitlerinema splendidum]